MEDTMRVLVEMVSDGDFTMRVTNEARLVTIEEMLYAGELVNGPVGETA